MSYWCRGVEVVSVEKKVNILPLLRRHDFLLRMSAHWISARFCFSRLWQTHFLSRCGLKYAYNFEALFEISLCGPSEVMVEDQSKWFVFWRGEVGRIVYNILETRGELWGSMEWREVGEVNWGWGEVNNDALVRLGCVARLWPRIRGKHFFLKGSVTFFCVGKFFGLMFGCDSIFVLLIEGKRTRCLEGCSSDETLVVVATCERNEPNVVSQHVVLLKASISELIQSVLGI